MDTPSNTTKPETIEMRPHFCPQCGTRFLFTFDDSHTPHFLFADVSGERYRLAETQKTEAK